MSQATYDRDSLISICERAFVPQQHWRNRDTSSAQRQLGEAYALIKAGCEFHILRGDGGIATNDHTIWIQIEFKGFAFFDYDGSTENETYYLPTTQRLDRVAGKDWY